MDDPVTVPSMGRPARRLWSPPGRAHKILVLVTTVLYSAVVAGVLSTSCLVRLDWRVMLVEPYTRWPGAHRALDLFVVAGQRGPATLTALAWLGWRARRSRSWRPVLVLLVAVVLLNVSVGAMKLTTGRLGPHYAQTVGSAEIGHGGRTFPSGHTANGVVTWGTVAYLAARHRRTAALAAGVVSFAIGLTTVYLGTHWVSDVLGGWAAGSLVLLALPLLEPLVGAMDRRIMVFRANRRASHVSLRPTLPVCDTGPVLDAWGPPPAAFRRNPGRCRRGTGAIRFSRRPGGRAGGARRVARSPPHGADPLRGGPGSRWAGRWHPPTHRSGHGPGTPRGARRLCRSSERESRPVRTGFPLCHPCSVLLSDWKRGRTRCPR